MKILTLISDIIQHVKEIIALILAGYIAFELLEKIPPETILKLLQ